MSLGKQKNLIVLGAVVAALLVGGVLVADYADVLPGRAKADGQAKPCASGEAKACCPAEAATAGFPQVMAATQAAPAQACCGGEKPAGACCNPGGDCDSCEKPAGGCGEPCPPDCPKPCCEMPPGCCEKPPAGCCEERQQTEVAGSCCAARADVATE